MNITLILLVYVVLPVLIIIAAFSKVMQEPVKKPRRATGPEYRRMRINDILRISTTFPTNKHHKQKTKLNNNHRKWIQIGRLENEMKHLKARYKRFKEYSQTMPSEDIEISRREISKELKRYKKLRKKLIRQVPIFPGE